MKESTIIFFLVVVFSLFGLGVIYASLIYSGFNFYKSEISVNGAIITEKIYFNPNQPYHTLYRDFFSEATIDNSNIKNSIKMEDVKCSEGEAYFRELNSCALFSNQIKETKPCPSYTENNEYGCTFGNELGFQRKGDYWIESTYKLNPENLFQINGKNYIKFVVYSSDKHVFLSENNFKVDSEIVKKSFYLPKEQVILYIPYNADETGFNILTKSSFEFDDSTFRIIFTAFFAFLPVILIFFIWLSFGKEKHYPNIPSELPEYPTKRVSWEVGAFFNSPFGGIGKNFFSTMLVSFYHKKIIDIQIKNKEVWIKVNETKEKLDKVENEFLSFLIGIANKSIGKKYFDGSYLYLKKALKDSSLASYISYTFNNIKKEIKEEEKKYIDLKGVGWLFIIIFFILLAGFYFSNSLILTLYYLFMMMVLLIVNTRSTLFIKFKEDYYKEYLQWRAFKRYLSHSFTISQGDHRAVAMWDNYLVYATALGVSKKVLKELKRMNLIDEKHFAIYSGIYSSNTSFYLRSSTGNSSSGGGFGGAGGGGIGGGGGGGR
jgi:uncharacterized membrane protein